MKRVTFLCSAYFGEEEKRIIEALSSLSIFFPAGWGEGGGEGSSKDLRINYTGIRMCEVGKYRQGLRMNV